MKTKKTNQGNLTIFSVVKLIFERYFIKALGAMALGLFSSLIIGLIFSQLSKISFLDFLAPIALMTGAASPVVGGAIGCAVAFGLKNKPLVIFSSIITGAIGYGIFEIDAASNMIYTVTGGPVGAFIASVIGAEIGALIASKTKIDIIVTPALTIFSGSMAGLFIGPYINELMLSLGNVINNATQLSPFFMGIVVAVIMGLALTAPISSAAIAISLGLTDIAAGAAAVGCSAQMVGFAVASYRDNGISGLISQGIGTSMLQFSNIMRKPQIWIAPTLASAILGPISTVLLKMTNTPLGAGMGTSGLVGQIAAFSAMSDTVGVTMSIIQIVSMHFVAPAVLAFFIDSLLRKVGIIKKGDMKIMTLSS